ncbi:cysteine desulfurase family protein [Dyadobacter luticola]|uniref:cysteine desulfurase n=1 Tax=Dyadobacter luticola TaxID=1979387 RepID=A0A5R9KVZ0_9BACT|nr:cysteine desulfurase family protein [Dyadobacter luticola]TLV00338.1 cysteine desulfurase [Dyadobacter luticola]
MDLIYLDYNATTPTAPEVIDAMLPFYSKIYGNASSTHKFGKQISETVKQNRNQIAEFMQCDSSEIIFTSGATEAINLAIMGVANAYHHKGQHIVTAKTEHPAVLDTCRFLEKRGFEVTYLSVSHDGMLNEEDIRAAVRPDTILVALMAINNETGVEQPLQQAASIAHEVEAVFLSDTTQAIGKIPFSINDTGVDIIVFSSHKFYGPNGIGGLFIRKVLPGGITLEASTHGGGHERGLRSGTLNVPGIVGMGKAFELAEAQMSFDALKIVQLRDHLERELLKIEGTFVNGNTKKRLYNVTNICFPEIDANVLIGQLDNIAVSNGSACSASISEPSHVLKAMGLNDDNALGSIRFSLGRYTTKDEIEQTIESIKNRMYAVRY